MALRLAEAQTLHDAVNDALFGPAIQAFLERQRSENVDSLLDAVRKPVRDTMNEARLAGKVEVYEECFEELRRFAQEQLKEASQ